MKTLVLLLSVLELSQLMRSVRAFMTVQRAFRTASKPLPTNAAFPMLFYQQRSFLNEAGSEEEQQLQESGYSRPVVQWYPGHIAKAERQLQETMKAVDVVIEVRDARAAAATSHPNVATWCAGRPRLVVLTHADMIPGIARRQWLDSYTEEGAEHPDQLLDRQTQNQARQAAKERLKYSDEEASSGAVGGVENVLFVNAKTGSGIPALTRAIFKAGAYVQERRVRKGLKERALRVGVIGYPNVGKSALINRLLGRRRARTANTPGVTRTLQWIRVKSEGSKNEFELLDSPGIIPATLVNQADATLLAACNCIGSAAYDNQGVASFFCQWMLDLHRSGQGHLSPEWQQKCIDRYKFDPLADKVDFDGTIRPRTGEDMLFEVADNTCQGDPEDASRKILQDFRTGRLGPICLQVAPTSAVGLEKPHSQKREINKLDDELEERAQAAIEIAKERGVVLPPVVEKQDTTEVGKGLFEGW